jgi:hypothetical protein
MQVIRTIKEADENGIVQVHLPSSFGRRVEVIILSLTNAINARNGGTSPTSKTTGGDLRCSK